MGLDTAAKRSCVRDDITQDLGSDLKRQSNHVDVEG